MSERTPRPWSKLPPPERAGQAWDAIVVGSGMGGMTAAAMLARLGRRVLVLEQHYVPGGFTHTFRRQGFTWDVGVHAVGEVTEKSLTGRLLAELSGGRLQWTSLGPVYDAFHFPQGFRVDFPDNPSQFRENLHEAFPRGRDAVDGYLAATRELANAMRPYYLARMLPPGLGRVADATLARKAQRMLGQHTAQALGQLTDDPRLRTVLSAQWGYYGSVPSRSSFAMQALVTRHFQWGAYYPVGGSGRIAFELLQTVADAGGWTRIVADVAEIVVERGRAVGVRLVDGETYRAPVVVSAAGIQATATRLLPEAHRDAAWARSVRTLPPSAAHLCAYVGFHGDIAAAGASAANQWYYDTWDSEVAGWDVHPDRPVEDCPILYVSFPSLKDPTHEPGRQAKHTGEIVTFVPWEVFQRWQGTGWRKRGEDYEAFKAAMLERMLDQLFQRLPRLRPLLAHAELSTPLSTDLFVRPMRGSIYGLEPTPERFANPWLRARSPVSGLFFAGGEVTSVGVIGAMMGGVLAAGSAAPREAWGLVSSLR